MFPDFRAEKLNEELEQKSEIGNSVEWTRYQRKFTEPCEELQYNW